MAAPFELTPTPTSPAPFATRSAPSRRSISKTRFMYFEQCALRAWLMEHDPIEHTPPPFGSIIWQGIDAGIRARSLVPDGRLIDCDYRDYQTVLDMTAELLADPSVAAIFEAGFAHSRVLIRADILERRNGGWCLGEVKSSTRAKVEHLIEIALQVYVLLKCGVDLVDAELILINPEYVRGDELDVTGLFRRVSVLEEIVPIVPKIRAQIEANLDVLALHSAPEVAPSRHCHDPYECEFWNRCTANKPSDWVYRIPRLSREAYARLTEAGIESMRDVPAAFRLTPTQRPVVIAAKTGEVRLSLALPHTMRRLFPPEQGFGCLDFETFMPGIPLYPNTSPYQRIPFQWSLHHRERAGNLTHYEFLARRHADPRSRFTETLLRATESLPGPIAVWSSYEGSVIRDLALTYPNLADRLQTLSGRLVDLLPIVRDHVAHPGFAGSYSIKSVAPVVAPEVSYAGLDVADGDAASAVIYRLAADPSLSKRKRTKLRRALRTYCERDTLALVHVHRWLRKAGQ